VTQSEVAIWLSLYDDKFKEAHKAVRILSTSRK